MGCVWVRSGQLCVVLVYCSDHDPTHTNREMNRINRVFDNTVQCSRVSIKENAYKPSHPHKRLLLYSSDIELRQLLVGQNVHLRFKIKPNESMNAATKLTVVFWELFSHPGSSFQMHPHPRSKKQTLPELHADQAIFSRAPIIPLNSKAMMSPFTS